jgi:UDP-glucuronate 4-epimerase
MKEKILVTGCAGFIGSSLVKKLLSYDKFKVYGLDNINNYYDLRLKKDRLKKLTSNSNFKFYKIDILNKKKIIENFKMNNYKHVFHLAAQAGVRFSIEKPEEYLNSNIIGFYNILEAAKKTKLSNLYFASSSSVYGDKKKFPLSENFSTDFPKSFYAATKKCNEVMAYSYSNLYNIKMFGLRFFTVYGPYGRPDMTPFSFLTKHFNKKNIEIYNQGKHERDFTYIDDAINLIFKIFQKTKKNSFKSNFEIFNVAGGKPNKLMNYIKVIEKKLDVKIRKKFIKKQAGDVIKTFANTKKTYLLTGYKSKFSIKSGISNFVDWYKKYYNK